MVYKHCKRNWNL